GPAMPGRPSVNYRAVRFGLPLPKDQASLVHHQPEAKFCGMTPTSLEAVHLVSSDPAAGLVKQVGVPRKHIRALSELLTIGPCEVDPERHVALRRAWNAEESRETFGLDDLRAAVVGEQPIIVWATRAYADLVWLWWVLDGLGRLGPLPQPLFVARPRLD